MKLASGWHVPDFVTGPGSYLARARDTERAIRHCALFGSVVQAGGHIGAVPGYLSSRFRTVYTFEPQGENFDCLTHNLAGRRNIFAARGVLADANHCRALDESTTNSGKHRATDAPGAVPSYRVDDLNLPDCSAIFLDVEGYEIPALAGARNTIRRYAPVIMAEENKRCGLFGYKIGDLGDFLAAMGYREVDAVGEDKVFKK